MINLVTARRGKVAIDANSGTTQAEVALAIRSYLKKLEFDNLGNLSPLTISKYEQCLKAYETWLAGQPISKDTAQGFLNFLERKGCSQSTRQAYYHAIKPFLKHNGIEFYKKFNKQTRTPDYHSPEQVSEILRIAQDRSDKWKHLSKRDSLMILTFAFTGMRKGELMALRVKDINSQSHMIYIKGRDKGGGAKGNKERTVPIDDRIYSLLKDYTKKMQITDRVFPLGPSRIGNIIKRYARAAGLPDFTPHSFRHYYATQLVRTRQNADGTVEPGIDLKTIQRLLGHADISTTAIYIDVAGEGLSKAVQHLPDITGAKK